MNNVTMGYGPMLLFSGITVQVERGQTLVVTGANGSGKSTFLKIAAGLVRPEEGTVKRGTRFGYAAPDAHPYTELTGAENLTFYAGLMGVSGNTKDLLARVGLPHKRGQDLVSAYSSGMRQRLKLALSLIGSPHLLIWDEPTLALDAAGGACIDRILEQHRENGGAAVIATNDLREAERWSHGRPCLDLRAV